MVEIVQFIWQIWRISIKPGIKLFIKARRPGGYKIHGGRRTASQYEIFRRPEKITRPDWRGGSEPRGLIKGQKSNIIKFGSQMSVLCLGEVIGCKLTPISVIV